MHDFGLLRCQRDGAGDVDAEVAEARGLLEFFGGNGDFDSGFGELTRFQILHGVKGGAGAERGEQEFWGSHACIAAAVVGWLIADDRVVAGLDGKADAVCMFDLDFHRDSPAVLGG